MQGFSFGRRFTSAASLLPTLVRNNRSLVAFLNTFTVRFDSDASTVALPGNVSVAGDLSVSGVITTDAWTAPSLLNSWVNFGAGDRTAGYLKTSDGTVHIKGVVKSGTAADAVIFVLPTGYRPSNVVVMAAASNSGFAQMRVASSGNVWMAGGGSTTANMIEAVFQLD